MVEPIAINIVFMDVAQRYRKLMVTSPKSEMADKNSIETAETQTQHLQSESRLDTLTNIFRVASAQNGLLSANEGEIVGEAWSRLLRSRAPENVEKFIGALSSEPMLSKIDALPAIEPQVRELSKVSALGFLLFNIGEINALRNGLKTIAQDTGMIDYENGQTLVSVMKQHIADIHTERGITPATPASAQQDTDTPITPPVPTSQRNAQARFM